MGGGLAGGARTKYARGNRSGKLNRPIKHWDALSINNNGRKIILMIQNQDRTEEKPISELMDPRPLKAAPQSADTQRRRAEEALRQSEERYRTIIDNIEDAYVELDLSGRVTFFNDCVVRLHGRSREELIGLSYKEYLDEESAKQVSQKFHRVYSTGE